MENENNQTIWPGIGMIYLALFIIINIMAGLVKLALLLSGIKEFYSYWQIALFSIGAITAMLLIASIIAICFDLFRGINPFKDKPVPR